MGPTKVFWIGKVLMLFLVLCCNQLRAQRQYSLLHDAGERNSDASISRSFHVMELEGIDTRQPMLYGYFFYDKDTTRLRSLAQALTQASYRLVRLDPVSDTEYILHVEKIEVHSSESLIKRTKELKEMAEAYKVVLFDGWDVGNRDPEKPIISKEASDAAVTRLSTPHLYEVASYTYATGDFKKAATLIEKCIENNYRLDTCYYRLGICMVEQDEFVKGIALFERCIAINPKYTKAYYAIGATCYDNMQFEKCVSYYQKALTLDPADDTIYYGIATGQYALGRYTEARANCNKALSLNSKNEYAQKLLARIPS